MRFHQGLVGTFMSLLAACTGTVGDDGGGDDTTNPEEPPPSQVRVAVNDANAPQAGVRVIFQNADDSVVLDTTTDAAGFATAEMQAGNVTVIRTYPVVIPVPPEGQRAPDVITYVGVKGGDLLELGNAEPATPTTPSAIVVKVPEGAAGTVTVKTPCGSGAGEAPNIAITVSNCRAVMDLYVTDGDQSSFFVQKPYAGNIDVSDAVLKGRLGSQIAASNVPLESTVNVDQRLVAGMFALYSSGEKRVDQTPANVNLPDVTGIDQLLVTRINTANKGTQMITERTPFVGSTVNVDASANLIPYVGQIDYKPTTVTWVEDTAGITGVADAVLLTYDVTRGAGMGGTPALDAEYRRIVLAPHTGLSLRLPVLPDALYNPSMADEIGGAFGIVRATGGYDALRKRAFAAAEITDTVDANGKITLSYTGQRPAL
ncbi:MAG: hypothetical protein SFX73_36730 [Kofleriaceae bacterium]|nr:hypothetical protein [Kofleriaceae bacterium]